MMGEKKRGSPFSWGALVCGVLAPLVLWRPLALRFTQWPEPVEWMLAPSVLGLAAMGFCVLAVRKGEPAVVKESRANLFSDLAVTCGILALLCWVGGGILYKGFAIAYGGVEGDRVRGAFVSVELLLFGTPAIMFGILAQKRNEPERGMGVFGIVIGAGMVVLTAVDLLTRGR